MRAIFWYFIMCLAIPLDYVIWNLVFAPTFGGVSFKKCVEANNKQYINTV